jgi:hypothetical protein
MRNMLYAGVLGVSLWAAAAAGDEYTRFEPLPYALAEAAASHGGCNRLALMNIPAGWQSGDAAVVLLTEAPLRDPLRNVLVAILLDEKAAVIEAVSGTEARCGPGEPEETEAEATAGDPLAVLFGVLDAARQAGAGLMIALGYGPGGEVALDAVREEVAMRHLAPGAPRFAAAAALGAGRPAFALGAPMPPAEAAPERLGLFCEAIDAVHGSLGEAARAEVQRSGGPCRAALAPGVPAPSRRRAVLSR